MDKKLRIGIAGMGNMGKNHTQHLKQIAGVEIAAICDEYIESAKSFCNEKGLMCPVFSDFNEMLNTVTLDAIYICLPPFCQKGQLESAAKKGIAVFIEKPIALNVERGTSMAEAVSSSNVHSQVGYQMRFGLAVRRFRELVESGKAGKLTLFSASYECNSLHSHWWREKDKCGGQVFEQVIHLYDMAQYLMGPVSEVSGHVANLVHSDVEGYTVEDTSVANLVFKSGALGCITGSNCAVKNQWNAKFRIVCENLVADFSDFNHATFTYTNEHTGSIETINGTDDVSMMEDEYFIRVLRGEEKPFATVNDGLSDLKLVSAVVLSSENSGQVVKLSN